MHFFRHLLWYGTRLTNWFSTLANGLQTPPKESPHVTIQRKNGPHKSLCRMSTHLAEASTSPMSLPTPPSIVLPVNHAEFLHWWKSHSVSLTSSTHPTSKPSRNSAKGIAYTDAEESYRIPIRTLSCTYCR